MYKRLQTKCKRPFESFILGNWTMSNGQYKSLFDIGFLIDFCLFLDTSQKIQLMHYWYEFFLFPFLKSLTSFSCLLFFHLKEWSLSNFADSGIPSGYNNPNDQYIWGRMCISQMCTDSSWFKYTYVRLFFLCLFYVGTLPIDLLQIFYIRLLLWSLESYKVTYNQSLFTI